MPVSKIPEALRATIDRQPKVAAKLDPMTDVRSATSRDASRMTTWMKSGLTALVALAALCSACTVTAPSVADPGFDIGSQTPTPLPDQTEQLLRVTIFDGNFDANIYEEQSGATQMLVISTGGPYTFEVDNLIERRELPAFGAVVIDYDTTAPRRYTMRAYSSTASSVSSAATAVLDIEPVGSR